MSVIIQHKRGTADQWFTLNPTLDAGEVGWESDTNKFKIGTGSTAWNSLAYATLTPSGLSATYAQLVGGNAFTGAQTITSTGTGQFPLTIIPATGQTVETFRIRNSANNADLLNISSGGALTINAAAGSTPYMNLPGLVTLGRQADNEINIRNLSQLRFESGNNWNYNSWAGLGFDSSNRNLYLGGPAGSANYFRNNSNAERVIFNLVGLSTHNSDAKDTILQSRGTNTRLIVRGKNQTATVSGVTGNGTTVTYTTSSAHYMDAGDVVTITGVNPSAYNLTSVTIASVPSQTTFTVTNAATGTFVSGGTATVNQANNLQEWQNSAGSILSRINSAGDLFTDRVNLGGAVFGGGIYYGKLNILQEAGGHNIGLLGRDNSSVDMMRMRQGANSIGDFITMQNSSGTTLGGRNAVGQIFTGSTAPLTTAVGGGINGVSANGTVVTISTTNAHNLANGDRVTIAGLTPAGYNGTYIISGVATFSFNVNNTTTGTASGSGTVSADSQVSVTPKSVGTAGVVVRSLASQVANPFEVQNSSGVVVANISPGGSVRATATLQGASLSAVSDGSTIATLSSGGNIQFRGAASYGSGVGVIGIANVTTAPSTSPSGGGILFVEAGALRYRGTSNASQTIANADGSSPFAILANNNSFLGRIFLSGGATIYDHAVETPGSTDTAWKKLIEVTCPTGLYTGASYELEVVDSFDNYGIIDRIPQRFKFYVKINRTGGVQDDVLSASVTGPSVNYVRVVKTSSSLYEIQVRQPDIFRIVSFKVRRIGQNNTTESYTPSGKTYGTLDAGSTTGTIYVPVNDSTTSANFLVDNFSQLSANRITIQPLGTLAATTPLLSLTGTSTQNSNFIEVRNSGGTILSRISNDGSWNQGLDSTRTFISAASGRIQVVSSNSTAPGIVLRPFAANYAGYDHMQYRNSADGIIGGVNVNGQIYTGSTAALTTGTGGATTTTSGTGTVATITTTSNHNLSIGDRVTVAGVTPTGYNGTFIVTGTPTTTSFTYNNTTTGSQTVAGTVSIDAQASIVARSAATTPLILRAAVNQGVNMFRIEGSAGGATATIDAAGAASFVSGAIVLTGGGSVSANGTVNSAGSMRIGSTGATLSGTNILYMASGTAPSASPISGGFLHVDSGALRYRGTSNPSTTIVNADGTIPIFSANNTFTGVQAFNNTVNIGSGVSGSVGLEIGSTNGTGTTPFIDFHSHTSANDFDARIIASGGTNSTNGAGTLTYTAGAHNFTGAITSQNSITGQAGVALSGTTSPLTLNGSAGTTGQVLTSAGSGTTPTWSSSFISTTSSYFAGHNPEGRLMYNTYLTNDMANARLRGSAVAATQNGSAYTISNANWDAMFDGTATFFNISPTSGFTFPLVITVPLPRTLTYGTWVGISFGSTTFRANSVQIEVFSLDSNSWVTVVNTTTNTSEDIFAAVSGLTNGNATGINQIRYTISNPNSTQLRLQHLWAYNFNSDMWSQTMMPRAGGAFYGAISVPGAVTMTGALNVNTTGTGTLNLGDAQISKAPGSGFSFSSGIGNLTSLGIGTAANNASPLSVFFDTPVKFNIFRGAANQTADILRIQSSAGTVLGGDNGVGQIFTGSTTPILTATGGTIQSIATGANPLVTMASAHGFAVGDLVTLAGTTGGTYNGTFVVASTPLTTTFTITSALTTGQAGTGGTASAPAQLSVTARSAGTTGQIVRGAASQSADLQQWQNNTPTTLASVSSNGSFTAPSLTVSSGGTYTTGSIFADSNWGMIFRSRTASPINAQYRWANSADGELMRLDNSGRLIVSNGLAGGVQGTAQIEARTLNATTIGTIVRGFGSSGVITQTADLQQWQTWNGTTATTVASISATGILNSGSGTYNDYNADSTIRAEFRGTAGTQRPYIELQGVGANDPANENGGAFIRFRTSRSPGYGAEIGGIRKSGGASSLILKTGIATTDAITQKMAIDENGNVFINGFAPGTIGLTVRGASLQSVNLQEWQTNSPTTVASVSQTGRGSFDTLNAPNGAYFGNLVAQPGNGAYLAVQGYAPGHRPFMVRGFGATTANLVDYQNGSGVVVGGRNGVGQIFTGSANPLAFGVGGATTATSGNGTTATITTTTDHGLAVGDIVTVAGITPTGYNGGYSVASTPTTTSFTYANATTGAQTVAGTVSIAPQVGIVARSAGTDGLVVRTAASQIASAFETQDVSGTTRFYIDAAHNANFSSASWFQNSTGKLTIGLTSASAVGLTVRGASGQSANLQEWQAAGSPPTVLASVNSAGDIGTTSAMLAGTSTWLGASLNVRPINQGIIGQVIRGTGTQQVDMLQIQTSLGVNLSGINANGQIWTGSTLPLTTSTGGATTATSGTGTVATVTTTNNHNLSTGDRVIVAGITPTGYNGTFIVTGTPTTTTFTYANTTTGSQTIAGTVRVDSQTSITSRSAATVGLVVRGATSQVTDIQQWQISDGTVRSYITADGSFLTSSTLTSMGNLRVAGTAGTGGGSGVIGIANAGTAPTSNPTGGGVLFVESGALRYRGTSNAARTIVNADGTLPVPTSVVNTVSGTNSAELVRGNMADNDQFRILVGGTATNTGFAEIATADDGTEPIHVRQYTGVFTTLVRTATLLDASGNTSFPGSLSSASLTTTGAVNLNYASPTIASNNASAASIFTSSVTGITIGSSTIRTTEFPADGTTSTAASGAGYMGLPQNATTTGAYTIVAADAGRHIYASATRTITINSNANLGLPIGTTLTFIAGSGATMTIAITSDTMYLAGPGTTGSRTLAPFGMATAVKITSTSWMISGNGLT
jgi:hypothetical protein